MFLNSNNAETTLDVALDDDSGDTTMVVTGDDTDKGTFAAFEVIEPGGSNWQLATLTNKTMPGIYEIVRITETDGFNFTVVRAQESTVVQVWPVGTTVGVRLTKGMLDSVLQRHPTTKATSSAVGGSSFAFAGQNGGDAASSSALTFGGRSRKQSAIQLSGYPILQLERSGTGSNFDNNVNFSYESIGRSRPVDIGTAVTWSATDFARGSVILPTTPDGYQYALDIRNIGADASTETTEPTWDGDGGGNAAAEGWWFPTELPIDITTQTMNGLVITEVGFIAHVRTASTDAVVSIGTESAPTRFANGVSLTQIDGNGMIHRIPITAGGAMVSGEALAFKVDTAATGGRCLGAFYWRGFFVETDPGL